jgi:hypothetical protein
VGINSTAPLAEGQFAIPHERRRDRRQRARHLARLDVRVSAWTARWRDHFLLMASLRVWDFRVNALIPYRRGRNNALMLGWGSSMLLVIGCRWVFALRDAVLNRIVRSRSSKKPSQALSSPEKSLRPPSCN